MMGDQWLILANPEAWQGSAERENAATYGWYQSPGLRLSDRQAVPR
jgi:hypothetical protein